MVQSGPQILVVADDWDERGMIASVLAEAGFAVAALPPESAAAAISGKRFAATVIALPGEEGIEFLRQVRRRQMGARSLLVVEPEALRLVDDDECATIVKRPFDP